MKVSDTVKVYKKLLKNDEERLLKKQARCEHMHWCTRCSHCRKILDSEKRDLKRRNGGIVNAEIFIK